jgi:branched-chain amino acid transport system substrate-binding protein
MRRHVKFLSLLLTVALLLTAVFNVSAGGKKEAENPTEFKMGFMTSLSGTFAAVGETQRMGTLLAVEEVNAKGGLDMPWGKVKITTLVKDDEAKLDVGVRRFRELMGEGINALTGTAWNPLSAAINEEAKITPIPYLAGNVPAIDSFKKGNTALGTYSVSFTPWSIGYLAGASVIKQMGKKTIFFVSRADSWGSTQLEGLKAAIAEYGGEIVGFAEFPLGTVDFSSAINKALEVKADVFMSVQFGGDAIAIFKQAYDMTS